MARTSMSAAAKAANVSRQAVAKARSEGRVSSDAAGKVDPAEVERAVRGRKPKPVAGADDGVTLYEAKRRKELALAQLRELEVAKLRGELLPAEDVRRADEAIYAALRDRLRAIPMSLAPLLVEAAHKPNAEHGVYTLLLSSIDEALTDIADAKIIAVDDDGNEIE